jgi:FkbM family methyltransferase
MLALKRQIVRTINHPWVGMLVRHVYGDQVPSRGLVIDTGVGPCAEAAASRLWWGLYERAEIDFVYNWLDPNLDVIELGSNIGVVATHIAKKLSRERQLICLEANLDLIQTVRANLQRNVPSRKVEVLNLAIYYGSSDHVLFIQEEDSRASRILDDTSDNPLEPSSHLSGLERIVCVPATQLSTLLKQVNFDDFALVCDIEGAEAGIILQDCEALQNCRQMIIELHPGSYGAWNCDVEDLRVSLENLGFGVAQRRGHVYCFTRYSTEEG